MLDSTPGNIFRIEDSLFWCSILSHQKAIFRIEDPSLIFGKTRYSLRFCRRSGYGIFCQHSKGQRTTAKIPYGQGIRTIDIPCAKETCERLGQTPVFVRKRKMRTCVVGTRYFSRGVTASTLRGKNRYLHTASRPKWREIRLEHSKQFPPQHFSSKKNTTILYLSSSHQLPHFCPELR